MINLDKIKLVGLKRYVTVLLDRAKENVDVFFSFDGYDGYFSIRARTARKAKKLGKSVDLFTGQTID